MYTVHRHSYTIQTSKYMHFTTFRSCRLWHEWWLRRQSQINAMKIIDVFIRWCISTIETGSRPDLKRKHMICINFFIFRGIQTHVPVFYMRAHQHRSMISSNEWAEQKKEQKKNISTKYEICRLYKIFFFMTLKTNQSK